MKEGVAVYEEIGQRPEASDDAYAVGYFAEWRLSQAHREVATMIELAAKDLGESLVPWRFLEVGAGTGAFARVLMNQYGVLPSHYYGIEAVEHLWERFDRKGEVGAWENGLYPNTPLVNLSYDCVLLIGVSATYEDPFDLLRACWERTQRVLVFTLLNSTLYKGKAFSHWMPDMLRLFEEMTPRMNVRLTEESTFVLFKDQSSRCGGWSGVPKAHTDRRRS